MTAMPERCRYAPDYALPPGGTLVEVLSERGMSQAELARRAGLSAKHVNQIGPRHRRAERGNGTAPGTGHRRAGKRVDRAGS